MPDNRWNWVKLRRLGDDFRQKKAPFAVKRKGLFVELMLFRLP